MYRIHVCIALLLALGCLALIQCSDDDNNPTNSSTDIPASLVSTWWWQSSTVNGTPLQFSEINNVDTSDAMSLTFNANNTWHMSEYYQQQEVYTQSGTCTNSGNSLRVLITEEDGAPVSPPDTADILWEVNGDVLVMNQTAMMPSDTIVMLTTMLRE